MSAYVVHAGGFGWDEALVLGIPVVVLVVLQLLARRKAAHRGDGDADDAGTDAGTMDQP